MELLERIWEILSGIVNAILGRFERVITSLFGSANARYLRRLHPRVDAINALESRYEGMSDEELAEHQARLDAIAGAAGGQSVWERIQSGSD